MTCITIHIVYNSIMATIILRMACWWLWWGEVEGWGWSCCRGGGEVRVVMLRGGGGEGGHVAGGGGGGRWGWSWWGWGNGGVIDFDDGLPCYVTNMPRETELHKSRGSRASMHPGILSWLRAECCVQNTAWQSIIKNSYSISLHNFKAFSLNN